MIIRKHSDAVIVLTTENYEAYLSTKREEDGFAFVSKFNTAAIPDDVETGFPDFGEAFFNAVCHLNEKEEMFALPF